MKHSFSNELSGSGSDGAPRPKAPHPSTGRRKLANRFRRLWLATVAPFHKSIHVRFRYVFAIAVMGLVLMAAIAFISSRTLLTTYENSVQEMRVEMMSMERFQGSLRDANRLAFLHAIDGDQSAPERFEEISEAVDGQIEHATKAEAGRASDHHIHSNIALSIFAPTWENTKAAARSVFQHTPGTPEAIEALRRVQAVTDSANDAFSEFHHSSLQDVYRHLEAAQRVGVNALFAMFGGIVAGGALLIVLGVFVGRSVLHPIAELHRAAGKLGKKDFSHRVMLRNTSDELGQLGKAFNLAATALQRLYRELERRSTHDNLTDILNRAGFDERLAAECENTKRTGRGLALLLVDIDFFKRVNDIHGHQAGDEALQVVAQLLEEATRPGDIVARYGGEEFAIILPDTDEASAMAMAERLRFNIEAANIDCGIDEDIGVTVSIGCASQLSDMMTPEDFIRYADVALYAAKDAGRNRVVSAQRGQLTHGLDQQPDAA
ncbi:diguanylate cyclase [Pararhizobium sp. IMCC21322]|uniref:diguanylate cyclase n=1 Tax=Pararhizobium sp. IMCC21322 TaxID=3067903 RepID=UPI00274060EA|nr:diguanylate cyclase [Pararhizobium sp. IMCC21322]